MTKSIRVEEPFAESGIERLMAGWSLGPARFLTELEDAVREAVD